MTKLNWLNGASPFALDSVAVSDDEMAVLDFVLPEGMLDRALELVDKGKVARLVGHDSRAIIHSVRSQAVRRSSESELVDRAYMCLPQFCTCHGFAERSFSGNAIVSAVDGQSCTTSWSRWRLVATCTHPLLGSLQCKHLMAVQIAEALGAAAVREMADSTLVAKQMGLLHPVMPVDVPEGSIPATSRFHASSQLIHSPESQDALQHPDSWAMTSTQLPG